jgi:hypothetical protein
VLRALRKIAPGLFQLGHHAVRHLQDRLGIIEQVFGAGLKLACSLDDRDHSFGQDIKPNKDSRLDNQ